MLRRYVSASLVLYSLFIDTLQGLVTRSKTTPYDRDVCFFYDGEAKYQQPLHLVSTKSAGNSLDAAVKKNQGIQSFLLNSLQQ